MLGDGLTPTAAGLQERGIASRTHEFPPQGSTNAVVHASHPGRRPVMVAPGSRDCLGGSETGRAASNNGYINLRSKGLELGGLQLAGGMAHKSLRRENGVAEGSAGQGRCRPR